MKYLRRILLVFILGIFICIQLYTGFAESLTYDEPVDAQEGINNINGVFGKIDPYNPPLIRQLLSQTLYVLYPAVPLHMIPKNDLIFSRITNTMIATLLLVAVYVSAKRMFGPNSGVFAVFLLAFEPNMLAHSHLVTLDIGTSFFIFVAYIFFLPLLHTYSVRKVVLFAFLTGLACASRVSAIPMVFGSTITAFVYTHSTRILKIIASRKRVILLFCFIVCMTIWASYAFTFDVVVKDRKDAARVSEKLLTYAKETNNKILYNAVWLSKNVPIPLGGYIAVLKNTAIRSLTRTEYFFLGHTYDTNRLYFFPITIILKIPLSLWIFFGISLYVFRKKKHHPLAYIYIPIVVIVLVLMLGGYQPWMRYALPVVPFICIASSVTYEYFMKGKKFLFVLLCVFYVCSSLSYFPHFLSYANELAGRREDHYKIFTDSNIDWGQTLWAFARSSTLTKPRHISLSYFGRDNGDDYGLVSNFPYGGHTFEDVCAFHEIEFPHYTGPRVVAISISNWHGCGYKKRPQFSEQNIRQVYADSILIF